MFDTLEFVKAVPSRQGRPAIGERFEPYIRIVENERWISVFHGAERIAKIPLTDGAAHVKAAAIRDGLISEFHAAVESHNVKVTEIKLANQRAALAAEYRQAAALASEYGPVETVTKAPSPVVVVDTVTDETPTATQVDAPKVAARSVTRRPVRKPAPAKAKTPAAPRKRK